MEREREEGEGNSLSRGGVVNKRHCKNYTLTHTGRFLLSLPCLITPNPSSLTYDKISLEFRHSVQEDTAYLASGDIKLLSIDADLTLFRVHTGGKVRSEHPKHEHPIADPDSNSQYSHVSGEAQRKGFQNTSGHYFYSSSQRPITN